MLFIMKKLSFICTILFLSIFASCNKAEEKVNVEKVVAKPEHITKNDFLKKIMDYEANPTEWKYLGDKPCIIDFYASWCGPCKKISPILEELAEEYKGQIHIYKVDTEQEKELSDFFGIQSIPTLMFCPMNKAPQISVGGISKADLKKAIDEVLLKKNR